jgi:hypothetical protein
MVVVGTVVELAPPPPASVVVEVALVLVDPPVLLSVVEVLNPPYVEHSVTIIDVAEVAHDELPVSLLQPFDIAAPAPTRLEAAMMAITRRRVAITVVELGAAVSAALQNGHVSSVTRICRLQLGHGESG